MSNSSVLLARRTRSKLETEMTFEELIDRIISSPASRNNILTDGQLTCCYKDLPVFFERIDRYLAEKGINRSHVLAVECANSVLSAVVLLYLFRQGYDFFLMPLSCGRGKNIADSKVLPPAFCQYQITIASAAKSAAATAGHPEHFLRIQQCGRQNVTSIPESGGAKLYLKTSGSMGLSKITMHSHTKLLGNAQNCLERFKFNNDDRIALPVPIFHMYGLGAAFLPGIMAGASIDLQENANILRMMERERQFDSNIAFLTPSLCSMLLSGRKIPRPYKLTVTAGDKMQQDSFRKFESLFGTLLNLYGSTEMGAIAVSASDEPLSRRAVTVGKPLPGVQLYLGETYSAANDQSAEVGKIWCRHEYGFEGYVDGHGTCIHHSRHFGWFATGDAGRMRPDGYIEMLGRCGQSINRNGLLVFFAEIETALEQIEGVEHAAVTAAKGESRRGQRLSAFCVLKHGAELSSSQIRRTCFEKLPNYAVPDEVAVVTSLPTLPNGKTDRQQLAQMASDS